MAAYTTYMSAVHAGCMMCQLYHGPLGGLAFSVTWLDCGPPDGACDAVALQAMLEDDEIPCLAVQSTPGLVERFLNSAEQRHVPALFQIQLKPLMPEPRWAILQGIVRTQVYFGMAVGEGEGWKLPKHVDLFATGQLVIGVEPLSPGSHTVMVQEESEMEQI